MLRIALLGMLQLTNPEKGSRKRSCTAIVLVVVCALTVSVATRYTQTQGAAYATVTVAQKHHSVTPGSQRLLNNAATWIPPVVEIAIFHVPAHHTDIAPSDSPISSVLLERNLYNRPPPVLIPWS